MAAPEVSIILPVYNAEAFLDEAFESILQQSFLANGGHLEVSVFDDGSSDRSAAVVEHWRDRLCAAYPDTLTFTAGANVARLAALARGERRQEAFTDGGNGGAGDGADGSGGAEGGASCGLCGQRKALEDLRSKKKSSASYCESCWQLPKDEWQAKRRAAYDRRQVPKVAGSAGGSGGSGVPCGIGFACNSAIRQSRGQFLCRFDADDVMFADRVERQVALLRGLPPEEQDKTIVGSGFVRMPEDATPRYTQWLNEMTEHQLMAQRFREVTLLHPTWMYHRKIWAPLALRRFFLFLCGFERVGGYTEDTSVGEDIVFFHKHLETGGLLRRVREPLLRYRCHPGQRSWRLPRRQVQSAKVAAFERQVLADGAWSEGFGVLGAGRDARDFCKVLSTEKLRLVRAFYEVDPKKIGKRITFPVEGQAPHEVPIVEQSKLELPFVVCVALERGYQVLEAIRRDQPDAQEGVDYFHLV